MVIESNGIEQSAEGAALLALAADPVRYQVLDQLAHRGRCVCELQEAIPVPLNRLSYHLRELREAGLVRCTKRGRRRDYEVAAGALERLRAALPGATAVGAVDPQEPGIGR